MEEHEFNTGKIVAIFTCSSCCYKSILSRIKTTSNHLIAKKQARGFGGMVSFDVGSEEKAEQVLSKVKYFTLAESLGAIESLISIPAKMTHASNTERPT